MRSLFLTLAVFFALLLGALAFADESGVVYDAAYPFTVTLDGDLGDWPAVPWHKITHDMGWAPLPDDDNDGSYEFACVADGDNLYIGIKTWDDAKCVDEDVGDSVYQDDSMELYIEADNSKPGEYEADCCQITVGRYNVGGNPNDTKLNCWRGGNGQGQAACETGTKAAVVDTNYGYAMEIAIPFAFFGISPADGTMVGFNIQLNDDDDNGGRDHKLSWSAKEREGDESAWSDPSVFGTVELVSISTAVSSEGKLATTWASIKK